MMDIEKPLLALDEADALGMVEYPTLRDHETICKAN
jgi:hypothetical protein